MLPATFANEFGKPREYAILTVTFYLVSNLTLSLPILNFIGLGCKLLIESLLFYP